MFIGKKDGYIISVIRAKLAPCTKIKKRSTYNRLHEVDFRQGESIEDFEAKNYYAPNSFELPIFPSFGRRTKL